MARREFSLSGTNITRRANRHGRNYNVKVLLRNAK